MILVFILLGILIFITLIITLTILSTIKIELKNIEIYSEYFKKDKQKEKMKLRVKPDYKIKIGTYFLNKIPLFFITIDNKKVNKIKKQGKLKNVNFKNIKKSKKVKTKDILKILEILQIKVKKLRLKINIGTADAIFTAFLVALIASTVGIILPHITENKYIEENQYIVNPIYMEKNYCSIKLKGIIYVKIVHIICSFLYLIKKGRDKNERTSNRRTYAYSNE